MTLLLGCGAVNTGNNLLYLLVSACLGFMAVSGVMGRLNLAALEVAVEPPAEIFDGRPTLVTVRLACRRRFPAFLLQLRMAEREFLFPLIPPREESTRSFTLTFSGRGEKPLPQVEVRSIFPINFFVRRISFLPPGRLLVFPAPRPSAGPVGADPAGRQGELARAARGYEGDLQRIRDYSGGDPLRLIHWKLSARQNDLKVKELEAGGEPPVILDPTELPGTDLEERLGVACWLIDHCLRRHRAVGLRLPERLIPPAIGREHRLALLRELALYGRP